MKIFEFFQYKEYYKHCYFKWASIYNDINVYAYVTVKKNKDYDIFFLKFYHGNLFA